MVINSKTKRDLVIVICIYIVVLVVAYCLRSAALRDTQTNQTILTPESESIVNTFDQAISDESIVFGYPSDNFGLAKKGDEIPVDSYVGTCNPDFDYCLYYVGSEYKGTNFESAGIRIKNRVDLTDEKSCIKTPPLGYDELSPSTETLGRVYSISKFPNIGDAAMGHFASGELYRFFIQSSAKCYEFETRIGQTRFENYPEGTKVKFTDSDNAKVQDLLNQVIEHVSLITGERDLFTNK